MSEPNLLDELDEADRIMRACGALYNELTTIYCHRGADHDGPHEGYSVVIWNDGDE